MTYSDAVEILSKPWFFRRGACELALDVVRYDPIPDAGRAIDVLREIENGS